MRTSQVSSLATAGADDILTGERHNLIIWNVNRAYREEPEYRLPTRKEVAPPDTRCLSYTHDLDFGAYKTYPAGTEHFEHSKAWCPPEEACYDSMAKVFSERWRATHKGQPGAKHEL